MDICLQPSMPTMTQEKVLVILTVAYFITVVGGIGIVTGQISTDGIILGMDQPLVITTELHGPIGMEILIR